MIIKFVDNMHIDLEHLKEHRDEYVNYIRLAKQMDDEKPELFNFINTWYDNTPNLPFDKKIENIMENKESASMLLFWMFLTRIADDKHQKEINKILFPNTNYKHRKSSKHSKRC